MLNNLCHDKLLQALDGHPTSKNTSDSWKSGIIPNVNEIQLCNVNLPSLLLKILIILTFTDHPSTRPSFTNQVSFLLESTVLVMFSLLYSQT